MDHVDLTHNHSQPLQSGCYKYDVHGKVLYTPCSPLCVRTVPSTYQCPLSYLVCGGHVLQEAARTISVSALRSETYSRVSTPRGTVASPHVATEDARYQPHLAVAFAGSVTCVLCFASSQIPLVFVRAPHRSGPPLDYLGRALAEASWP